MNEELLKNLASWSKLNKTLDSLNESDVFDLLGYEMITRRRVDIVTRLHQRGNALRVKREREELVAACGGAK